MVAGYLRHFASWASRRHPEPVVLALDDERRHRHGVELVEAALWWLVAAARRLERKARQSTPTAPVSSAVRQATQAPIERPPTMSGRPASSPALVDDRDPRGVQLRAGGAAPGDAVGLLDQGDGDFFREGGLGRRDEVERLHAAGGPVTENEGRARLFRVVQVCARGPCRVSRSRMVTRLILPPPRAGCGGDYGGSAKWARWTRTTDQRIMSPLL